MVKLLRAFRLLLHPRRLFIGQGRRIALGAAVGLFAAVACAVIFLSKKDWLDAFRWYHKYRDDITPVGAAVGGALLAWIAFGQMRTARLRHEEQTKADLQRRITESYAKAAEQLGSEKLEVRLGGIYTMQRIARESKDDFKPIVNTISAFVRAKQRWKGTVEGDDECFGLFHETTENVPRTIPVDVFAGIEAISQAMKDHGPVSWDDGGFDMQSIDLRGGELRRMNFVFVDFSKSTFENAQLETCNFSFCFFDGSSFQGARFDQAVFANCAFRDADFTCSTWNGCLLLDCLLTGSKFGQAVIYGHIESDLSGTNLEGADLRRALIKGGSAALKGAITDQHTKLPAEFVKE